jgi:hypothetical protein
LIIVELTLEKVFNSPVKNIVITDLLPAGFEIENPRTKEIPGMDWIKDASTPINKCYEKKENTICCFGLAVSFLSISQLSAKE